MDLIPTKGGMVRKPPPKPPAPSSGGAANFSLAYILAARVTVKFRFRFRFFFFNIPADLFSLVSGDSPVDGRAQVRGLGRVRLVR